MAAGEQAALGFLVTDGEPETAAMSMPRGIDTGVLALALCLTPRKGPAGDCRIRVACSE